MLHYVPIIKSKKNDIEAVVRLSEAARAITKPLLEAPINIENKQVITDVAKAAAVALHQMPEIPFYFDPLNIEAEFRQLSALESIAQQRRPVSPTFGVHRFPSNFQTLRKMIHSYGLNLGVRVELQDIDQFPEETWARIIEYSAKLDINANRIELLLDLLHVHATKAVAMRDSVLEFIALQPKLFNPKSITVIGSSALASVAEIDPDGYAPVKRVEREIWADINFELDGTRLLGFGDYGVINPSFAFSGPNPNANAKIRYTRGSSHHVFRGHGLYNPSRFGQYFDLAKRVVDSGYFFGRHFSYGDEYIASCACGEIGPGNLATWVKVDTNHHLEVVSRQTQHIANELSSVSSAANLKELLLTA